MKIEQLSGKQIAVATVMELHDPVVDQTDVLLTFEFADGEMLRLLAGDPNAESYYTALSLTDEDEITASLNDGCELVEPSTPVDFEFGDGS